MVEWIRKQFVGNGRATPVLIINRDKLGEFRGQTRLHQRLVLYGFFGLAEAIKMCLVPKSREYHIIYKVITIKIFFDNNLPSTATDLQLIRYQCTSFITRVILCEWLRLLNVFIAAKQQTANSILFDIWPLANASIRQLLLYSSLETLIPSLSEHLCSVSHLKWCNWNVAF